MADEDLSVSDALAKAREYTDKLNPLNYLFPTPDPKQVQEAKESGQKLVGDYADALREANAGSSALVQKGVENMKSGNPAKMVLGAGQDVLGTVSPVLNPAFVAPWTVASKRATEYFGEPVGNAVDALGMFVDPSHFGKLGHVAATVAPISKVGELSKASDMAKLTEVQPRKLNPMGLYSAAEERALQLNQTAPVEQLVNQIRNSPGIKTEELVHAGVLVPDYDKVALIRAKYQPQIADLSAQYKTSGSEEIKKQLDKVQSAMATEEQSAFVLSPTWAGKGKISSKELAEHFNASIPQLERSVYGGNTNQPTKYHTYALPGGKNYTETVLKSPEDVSVPPELQAKIENASDKVQELDEQIRNVRDEYLVAQKNGDPTEIGAVKDKYAKLWEQREKHQQDIYDNLRILNSERAKNNYTHRHWEDDVNPVAHHRTSEYIGPNGERILHAEEMQSDIGQQAREKGFIDPAIEKKREELKNSHEMAERQYLKDRYDLDDQLDNSLKDFNNAYRAEMKPWEDAFKDNSYKQSWIEEYNKASNAAEEKFEYLKRGVRENYDQKAKELREKHAANIHDIRTQIAALPERGQLPRLPYAGSTEAWTDLVWKDLFRKAAEGGYDKVTWTRGETQANRYDLTHHLGEVTYNPIHGTLSGYNPDGQMVLSETVSPDKLHEYLPRELADKLKAEADNKMSVKDEYEIVKIDETGKYGLYLYGEPTYDYHGNELEFNSKQDAREHLDDLISSEFAQDPPSISGLDLKVGGEGMHKYYDQMAGKRAQSVLKPHAKDVKITQEYLKTHGDKWPFSTTVSHDGDMYWLTGEHPSKEGDQVLSPKFKTYGEAADFRDNFLMRGYNQPVHSIDITPELRNSILTKGFAAHKDGGRVGYATKGGVDPLHGEPTGESASPMMDEADEIMRKLNVIPQALSGLDMQIVQPGIPSDRGKILSSGSATTAAALRAAQNANQQPITRSGADILRKDPALAANPPVMSERGRPFHELEFTYVPRNNLVPWKEITPEDIYKDRGYITPAVWDRTSGNVNIQSIMGNKLTAPFDTQGGGDFQRSEFARGKKPAASASRDAAVKNIMTRIRGQKIPEDRPLYLSSTLMGIPASDSSIMMAKALLRQMDLGKIDKSGIDAVNNFMSKKVKDWPGIENPKAVEKLLSQNNIGAQTSFLSEALDKATPYKANMPDVGAARFAITDPRLFSPEQLATGYSMSKIDLSKEPFQIKKGHETYPTKIPSVSGYEGGLKYQVPSSVMFPDWESKQLKVDKNGNPITLTNKQQALMTQIPVQEANQKWLDNFMKHLEEHKKVWGYRKGGRTLNNDAIGNALSVAQEMGNNGDSMIAHINPQEADILKALGGSGTINPNTGLLQFDNPSMGSYDGAGDISGNADTSSWGGGNFVTNGGGGGGNGNDNSLNSATRGISLSNDGKNNVVGGGSSSSNGPSSSGQASQNATEKQIQDQINAATAQSKQIQSLSPDSDMAKQLGIAAPEAPNAPQVDQTPFGSYNFSNAQMATPDEIGGFTPGGISNYANTPQHPGYVDTGVTAMRLSADDPNNRSVGYYMDKLNKIDPRFQGTVEGIANARLEQGIPTTISPRGGFRTAADQAALLAEKAAGLNPNPVAPVGTSLHQFTTIDPQTGQKIPSALAIDFGGAKSSLIDQINKEAGAYTVPDDLGHIQAVPHQSGAYQVAQSNFPSFPDASKYGPNLSQDVANLNEKMAMANDWYNTPIVGGIVKNQIENAFGPIQQATPAEEQRIANIINQSNAPAPIVPDDFGTPESLQRYLVERGYVTSGPNRAGSMGSIPSSYTTYDSNLNPTNVVSNERSGSTGSMPESVVGSGSPVESYNRVVKNTARQDFEKTFNEHLVAGDETFEWTNPLTGVTSTYSTKLKASGGSVVGNDAISNALRIARQHIV
jgi:hypothetical protein